MLLCFFGKRVARFDFRMMSDDVFLEDVLVVSGFLEGLKYFFLLDCRPVKGVQDNMLFLLFLEKGGQFEGIDHFFMLETR